MWRCYGKKPSVGLKSSKYILIVNDMKTYTLPVIDFSILKTPCVYIHKKKILSSIIKVFSILIFFYFCWFNTPLVTLVEISLLKFPTEFSGWMNRKRVPATLDVFEIIFFRASFSCSLFLVFIAKYTWHEIKISPINTVIISRLKRVLNMFFLLFKMKDFLSPKKP